MTDKAGPKILVVGAGYFGRHWMNIVNARSDCALAGVVATDAETLAAAEAEWRGQSPLITFTDLDQAIRECKPSLAIVAVPEAAHRSVICALVRRNVHCLSEKPLALTWDDAKAIHAARPSGTIVAINQQFRWRPTIQTLRAQLQEGAIGDLGEIDIVHRQDIRRTTTGGWRETMEHPYLFDMAVHFFDLIRYLSGREALSIAASAYRPKWSMFAGYPALNADIAMEDGVHARLSGTFVARGWQTIQEGLITLTGSDGTLRLNETGTVTIHKPGTERSIPLVECREGDCDRTLSDVLAGIRFGSEPPTSLADNLKTFAIVVAAESACKTGQTSKITMEF